MEKNLKELLAQMTLEEKAGMCSGLDFWHLKNVERLGIPSIMVSDGPHGLRKQEAEADHLGVNESIDAVCFPPACLNACAFDMDMQRELGEKIGQEAQATDISVVLGPAVNIKRSPLCGRNFEYYSEDPYLAGETAASFIQGVQSQNVGTSIKHFAANNQEFNRMSNSSEVTERTLREIYFPAFEIAVKKSQPYTVMCSYNQINGTFASENNWLLNTVLRDEWGFKGMVMSDWGAVNNRVPGLEAGMDLEMPASNGMSDAEIVAAVKDGSLEEAVLDKAVERILHLIFHWEENRKEQEFTLEDDHAFAQHVAEQSMVLLKNEDVLPLSQNEKVAFIGGFAKNPRFQGGGSSHINAFRKDSALDAVSGMSNVSFAEGFSSEEDVYDETLAAEAIEVAKAADKVVVFAGLPESFESEGYDRKHMDIPACQNRLIAEIAAVQPNIIVALHNGAPVEMPWLSDIKGLVEAYLGGQAGGKALVNILFGNVNPSGKLAETIPLRLQDNPSYLNFGYGDKVNYREDIFVGYRYYDAKNMAVAFPFGHGLSYTTFTYSNLKVDKSEITDQDQVVVSVDVTNSGAVAGKEIVQLYVSELTREVSRPEKELKGFSKVSLEPGETKTVTMTLDKRSFAYYDVDLKDWYAASGMYEIIVGASSRDIRLVQRIKLESSVKKPLFIHLNSTIGELKADERSRAFAVEIQRKMDEFFHHGEEVPDDNMGDAIAASMPIRNILTFGLISKEDLMKKIEEFNRM